jgi:hypothetical protein
LTLSRNRRKEWPQRTQKRNRDISRKGAKAAKVGKNGENHLREYFTFPSELGAFAPWREEFPNPRTLDFRNI